MGNVGSLCEAEFLDRIRRSPLLRWAPAPLGFRDAALLKAGAFFLLGLLLYVPPLAQAGALGPLPGSLSRPALVMNLAAVFFGYFGLFSGAWLASDQVLGPNEQILAFPITLGDLARFRLWEGVKSALKTALFVVLPVVSLAYLGAGWSVGAVVAVLATGLLVLLTFFLAGMVLMLLILRVLRSVRPESVFIAIFLSSTWLFVAALNLSRWDAAAGLDAGMRRALSELESLALPALLDRIAAAPVPFAVVAGLLFLSLAPVVYTLLLAAERALTAAYVAAHRRGAHGVEGGRTGRKERPPRLGYGRVARVFRLLPLTPRALLTRDVLSIIRRRSLVLRLLALVLPLLLLPSLGRQSVRDPAALAIYLFSAFLGSRLFLESGSADMEGGLLVRQSFSSGWSYLQVRLQIVFGATAVLLAPVLVAIGAFAGWGFIGGARSLFVLANVLLASLLLVPFSVLAAHESGGWSGSDPEARPFAQLLFWLLGAAAPFFFYRLDLALQGEGLLGLAGVLAGTTAIVSIVALNVVAAARMMSR